MPNVLRALQVHYSTLLPVSCDGETTVTMAMDQSAREGGGFCVSGQGGADGLGSVIMQ